MPDREMLEIYRKFLNGTFGSPWGDEPTDKARGVPAPPREKPYPADATLIDLTPVSQLNLGRMPVAQAIKQRKSRRQYSQDPMTLDELGFLLWATQGVHKNFGAVYSLRTVPAGGAVHPFETYLSVHRIRVIKPGVYRYLPTEHKLCLQYLDPDEAERFHRVRDGFDPEVAKCAVYFIWTVVPYRHEWGGGCAKASDAIQVGHVCQNLYIASEAIGCGTCATSVAWGGRGWALKYDELLGVNGRDEFTIYAAAVGKLKSGRGINWTGQVAKVDAGEEVTRLWVKSFTGWDGDVFVVEFPTESVAGYAKGTYIRITGEIVEMCSAYDGWPLVEGSAIERREDPRQDDPFAPVQP